MKKLLWIPVSLLLASCNQAGTGVTRPLDPQPGAPKRLTVHPVTEDKDYIAEIKKIAAEKIKNTTASTTTNTDPAMLGDYKFVLNSQQQKQIDESVARMEKDIAAGNTQAASALAMAKGAIEIANKMVVTLTANGRYHADFGSGVAGGKFTAKSNAIILTPDEPSTKPGDPKDVELIFDKAAGTLTANFQGEKMLFQQKK